MESDSLLEILIRKELTHTDKEYRQIGVVGACTLLEVFSEDTASVSRARIILTTMMTALERDWSVPAKTIHGS